MEPQRAVLFDEACAEPESISQVDGCQDSPLERLCRRVEVEGVELEEEERSMKGWCQVRRKSGQEVKDVSTKTRGWEEFYDLRNGFPYLAHYWRYERWSKEVKKKEWTEEELRDMQSSVRKEKRKEYESWRAYSDEVVKWVHGGGVD